MTLYQADEIRKKIQAVLSVGNGSRYAIVAFIGQDVLDFVQDPKGLIVYCWPNVSATHPDGVRDLISKGATVYFVDKLHIKLYWSRAGGAVLGSCNLTKNALGGDGSGLFELAYFIRDSSKIDIDAILQSLKKLRKKVTPEILTAYRRKYQEAAIRRDEYAFASRNKTNSPPLLSFAEYLQQPQQRWSIACWGVREERNPRKVVDAAESYGKGIGIFKDPSRYIVDWIECDHKARSGEWVLSCKYVSRPGILEWKYTHIAARKRINGKTWFAIEVKKQTERPPFNCKEERFVAACHAFVKEMSPMISSIVMTDANMKRLAKWYKECR